MNAEINCSVGWDGADGVGIGAAQNLQAIVQIGPAADDGVLQNGRFNDNGVVSSRPIDRVGAAAQDDGVIRRATIKEIFAATAAESAGQQATVQFRAASAPISEVGLPCPPRKLTSAVTPGKTFIVSVPSTSWRNTTHVLNRLRHSERADFNVFSTKLIDR